MKRAYAEINRAKLLSNLDNIHQAIGRKVKIMGIVKADAYGHGAVPIAKTLQQNGVQYFGVAWLSEAEELRSNGLREPILVLSQPDQKYIDMIIKYDLVQTVYTEDFLFELSKRAGTKKVKVHVKIDTGMNRIGITPEDVLNFIGKIKGLKNIELEGVLTHFACADNPQAELNKQQIKKFKKIVLEIESKFGKIPIIHAANTAAVLNLPEAHFDLVRVGIGLYRGVMSFKSQVMLVKDVSKGTPVSYGSTFITKKRTTLATISAGYADGLSRRLSNKGSVLIRGKEYPIVGNVCMDMTIVDVTGSDVAIGDEVVLIGSQGDRVITAETVAKQIGTIDYEVLCGVSKRVPRIYL